MLFIKKILSLLLLLSIGNSLAAQNSWDIRMARTSVDCAAQTACYQLEAKNNSGSDWTLGDQNYRLFFDGDLMTVTSVTSLLPSSIYGSANIDMNIKYTGVGQDAASPLDDIDDHLGFLDFSIVQNNKTNPSAAVQLNAATYTPIAEICVEITPEVITGNDCLSFYHSRPSTAGAFTNQYTTISENNASGSTISATGNQYDDLTSDDGTEACLMSECNSGNEWDIRLTQSFLNCQTEQVCYRLEVKNSSGPDWALGDQNYRLFFDGDLMTVTSITSLLPSGIYGSAIIDMNQKYTGAGQEATSPLDDIDDHLGFLDFNIVQNNKMNPTTAVQLTAGNYTPVAEICVEVADTVLNDPLGGTCLSFYHSRFATAGSFTNQYTTISENDAPNSTAPTMGMNYNDMNSSNGDEACLGMFCADCPTIGANIGNTCDDGDPNTVNDIIQNDCSCSGTIQYDCPTLSLNFGDACDDGNPNTLFDEVQNDCTCRGSEVYDCPIIKANIGDTCDDGNPNTFNDRIRNDCSCIGTPIDCDDVTNPGSIAGSKTICPGEDAGTIINAVSPSGGTGGAEYMWLRNNFKCDTTAWKVIPGAEDAEYNPGILTQTTYFRRCVRRESCPDWNMESNCVAIIVDPNCATAPSGSIMPCEVQYAFVGDHLEITGLNVPLVALKFVAEGWLPLLECDPWGRKCNSIETIKKPKEKGTYYLHLKTFEDWYTPGCDLFEKIEIE